MVKQQNSSVNTASKSHGLSQRLGDRLKAARNSKQITLEAAAQATKIRSTYLQALESHRWSEFPADVYLWGFLKKYAEFLGLSPKEMAELLIQEKERPAEEKPADRQPLQEDRPEDSPAHERTLIVWMGLLVGAAGVFLYLSHQSNVNIQKSPPPLFARSSTPDQEHVLSVMALKNTWLSVSTKKGRRIFEGIVPATSIRIWRSSSPFVVRVRKASDLRVEIDGSLTSMTMAEGRDIELPSDESR